MAYGMMSSRAMERNNEPENVIAILIIEPSLKHFIPEMNLPKSMTYEKNTSINTILMMVSISMLQIFIKIIKKMNNLNVINNLVKILIEKIRKIVKSKTCHFQRFYDIINE